MPPFPTVCPFFFCRRAVSTLGSSRAPGGCGPRSRCPWRRLPVLGFLAGVPVEEERAKRAYPDANQGSLIIALDITKFTPLDDFKFEMNRYMQLTSETKPLPGFDRATLPGVLEAERQREWIVNGIPVGKDHRDVLEKAASELGMDVPF